MTKMKKGNVALIVLIVILILAIGLFAYYTAQKTAPVKKEKVFFTPKAENWIYDNPSTMDTDVKIDVFIATEGTLRLQKGQQDYFTGSTFYSFFYSGSYKGNQFKSEYLPDYFFNLTLGLSTEEKKKKADELTLMRITNEFKADDGIVNGFIIAKEENRNIVFYLFVDEDWKSQLSFTNIIWGDNFRDEKTLHVKQFDFSRMEKGIYIDKISVDADWYKQGDIKGGIIFGEITLPVLSSLIRGEEHNITYMMVR